MKPRVRALPAARPALATMWVKLSARGEDQGEGGYSHHAIPFTPALSLRESENNQGAGGERPQDLSSEALEQFREQDYQKIGSILRQIIKS
ncbi:MAG: hypothetical protein ACRERE_27255 [Candidatus Entotheonellia bacterium]